MAQLDSDLTALCNIWGQAFTPLEDLTVWEYAAKHINLSKKISSFPGFYRPDLNPMLNVAMQLLSPQSRAESTVLLKGTQCGGSLVGKLWMTYIAGNNPGPTIVVTSDEDERDEYSSELDEFFACCKPLQERLDTLGTQSKLEVKQIPGTKIHLSTATVPRSLRGKHAQNLYCSETSNWVKSCQGQGDPFVMALNRTDTFDGRKKIYAESTPTDPGSNIEKEFKKCKHHITMYWACPHCGFFQSPDFFEDMRWDETVNNDGEKVSDHRTSYLVCQNSTCPVKRIEEEEKEKMLSNFRLGPVPWYESQKKDGVQKQDSRKRKDRQHFSEEDLMSFEDLKLLDESVGIWFNPVQTPRGFKSWPVIVKKFLNSEKHPEEKQPFWNNDLGRSYEGEVSSIKTSDLVDRVEKYSRKPLPVGCHLLTAGVDVNGSWLSVEITGWGKDKESWTVDFHDIPCDPAGPLAWQKLDEYLSQTFEHCSGKKIRISAVCIDSGYLTQQVASFVRKHMGSGRNIIAIKGLATPGRPIISKKPKEYKKGIDLTYFSVGTTSAKDTLAAWLKVTEPGPCYCHFGSFLSARYFEEMSSEKLESKKNATGIRRKWVKIMGRRNEAWDCRVYSLAALEYLLQIKDLNEICEIGEKKYRESGRANAKTA